MNNTIDERGNGLREFELQRFLKALAQAGGVKVELGTLQPNCMNCIHFQKSVEICSLNGRQPPIRIAVTGCNCWADDMDVPF